MSDNDRPDRPESEPIDGVYGRAEAALSDEAARLARRARVLAAVAREGVPARAHPRGRWRPAPWLAAASVAGLSLFMVARMYPPIPHETPRTGPPVSPASSEPQAPAASTLTPAPAPAKASPPQAVAPQVAAAAPKSEVVAPPAPPPPPAEPERRAFPAAPKAAPPAPPPEVVASAREAQAQDAAAPAEAGAERFARSSADRPASSLAAAPAAQPDQGARLRAAAAGGRTAEVEALLRQGAVIDDPDADGDTALMKSLQRDHPAVAALLRRHGASLDRKNHAGQSARDMAKSDAALRRALGLEP